MEGTIGEIRCFAGDFSPKNWAFCNGQQMAIAQNQALFAILGTTYGGNGVSTFALPNMQSRTPVGTGKSYVMGSIGGAENVTLQTTQIPAHTHIPTVTAGTAPGSGTLTINGTGAPAIAFDPKGNLLAADDGSGAVVIYAPSTAPVVAMSPKAISIAGTIAAPTINVALAGSSQPHSNIQPSLGINFVICLYGIFPSRN
jgi:microcystin-dependent protein